MPRIEIDPVYGADLDDLAEVHDHHAVTDIAHDIEVVTDEHISEVEARLEVHEQVQHLCFDRLVKRGDGLVQNDDARLKGEGARHVDALALAA